jgi:hypothetical protein
MEVSGVVILGRELWKVRRKSEDDEIWTSMLADGLSRWVEVRRHGLISLTYAKKADSLGGKMSGRVGAGPENENRPFSPWEVTSLADRKVPDPTGSPRTTL